MPPSIRDTLPAAHRRLLPSLFDRPAIEEKRATCSDCAMCPKGAGAPPASGGEDVIFFRPDTKCCTYFPTLPNFLVGAILADDSPGMAEGRRRVKERIASRVGVTPQWLAPPRKYRVLLDASRLSSFGRSRALLCPYFEQEGSLCTIWRHRDAICSTFFCKHDAGAAGHAFWDATEMFLRHVEGTLARAAAQHLAPGGSEPATPRLKLTLDDLEDRPPNAEVYARYWADWQGREEEFYLACHAYLGSLGPADLDALFAREGSPGSVDAQGTGARLLDTLTARYEALAAPRLHARLVPNPQMRLTMLDGGVATTTYSAFDAQWLSQDLYEVIQEFRPDQSVEETRARLKREHDLDIPDELLIYLQQHEILVPPSEP